MKKMTRAEAENLIANCIDFEKLNLLAQNAKNKHPKQSAIFKLQKLYPNGPGIPSIFQEKFPEIPDEKIQEFWHNGQKKFCPKTQGKLLVIQVMRSCAASRSARSKRQINHSM